MLKCYVVLSLTAVDRNNLTILDIIPSSGMKNHQIFSFFLLVDFNNLFGWRYLAV